MMNTNFFELDFDCFDFLTEAINHEARLVEEADARELNSIYERLGMPDRIELLPESAVLEDKNGIDGRWNAGPLVGKSFDLKHHKSTKGTGLVDAQILSFNAEIRGRVGWMFWGVNQYIIWWLEEGKYAIIRTENLRNRVMQELRHQGIDPAMFTEKNQFYMQRIRNSARGGRMMNGELVMKRWNDPKDPTKNTSQVSMYISLDSIPDVTYITAPSASDEARMERERQARRAERERMAELEWEKMSSSDEEKARQLLHDIKELLAGDWNQFGSGFFRWSPSRKNVVFYKPKSHKIEEFNIADIGSHNETFRELVYKLKAFVGTLSSVSLPASMEQLRNTAISLGMPPNMDFDVFMRKLAQVAGTIPTKWDFIRDSGMLRTGAGVSKLRKMRI